MGSVDFSHVYDWSPHAESYDSRPGPVTAESAFSTLYDEIGYQSGHSYSGTIASTSLVSVDPKPVTLAEATDRYVDAEYLPKGETFAVALLEEVHAKYETDAEPQQVTMTVAPDVYSDHARMRAAIAKTMKVKTDRILDWHMVRDGATLRGQITRSVQTTAPKGKTQTRYFPLLSTDNGLPKWERGHTSQAEARAALSTRLDRAVESNFLRGWTGEITGEVVSMTRRVTGEALVTGVATPKKVTVELVVRTQTMTREPSVGTKQGGWYFYGCAPS